ncbi:unnamed protein product [Leptosia nina]|uniref:Uncharacterized protein n=1 Tax=Leptosia nina TaxID=320188 RepID=A0AAV1JBE3_9NEOP
MPTYVETTANNQDGKIEDETHYWQHRGSSHPSTACLFCLAYRPVRRERSIARSALFTLKQRSNTTLFQRFIYTCIHIAIFSSEGRLARAAGFSFHCRTVAAARPRNHPPRHDHNRTQQNYPSETSKKNRIHVRVNGIQDPL